MKPAALTQSDERDLVWSVGIALVTVAAALGMLAQPALAVGGVLVLTTFAVLMRPTGRLVFITVGGLLVLQSESTGGKVAYLAGASFILLLAVIRLGSSLAERPDLRSFRPLLIAAVFLGVYMLGSVFLAIRNGTSLLDWARDAAPYLLIAAMPFIAVDSAATLSRRVNERLLLIVGGIAAIAFMIDWTTRRTGETLGTGRFALASFALCALLFCYALARSGGGKNRTRWIFLALLVPGAILVTGTRSALLFFIAVAAVMGPRDKARIPPVRLAALTLVVGAALYLVLPVVASVVYTDPTFFQRRVAATTAILTGEETQHDQSYQLREVQYDLAKAQIAAHPLFGTAPGYRYRVPFPNATADTFTLDTPFVTPAKIGWLGTIILAGYVAAFGYSVLLLRRRRGYSPTVTAARAFGLVTVCSLPLGSFFEDKGAALAILLLVAALASDAPATERSE